MKITEPSRKIDVVHRTDVLVVGAGPGGLAAALAAARAGALPGIVTRGPLRPTGLGVNLRSGPKQWVPLFQNRSR